MITITSIHNERVKQVRALQSKSRNRRREGKIVLEGVRLLADALDCGAVPEYGFYLADDLTLNRPVFDLFQRLVELDVLMFAVTEPVMREMSDTETPQGVLAVLPLPEVPAPENPDLVLVLDGINIPGNLGTALRTAAAAGVDMVVLPPDTVDPYNPKVLRGGMGAHFRLPIVEMTWEAIGAQFGHLNRYVASADGDLNYYDVDWRQPSLIVVGGEAHGPTGPAQAGARTIAIPMVSTTESLNAAVAAGVIIYEARRQRLTAQR